MTRPRLHKSSIVLGLFVTLLLALINIPGRFVTHQTSVGQTFEHGWPFVYLRRLTSEEGAVVDYQGKPIMIAPHSHVWLTRRDSVQYLPMWGIPWLTAANWKFWEADIHEGVAYSDLRESELLLDCAIALIVLISLIAAWEVRRRRRPRLLCFTLGDTIVAVSVVSIALAALGHLNREYQPESQHVEKQLNDSNWVVVEHECIAPTCLRSLIGDRLMPDFLWRLNVICIDPECVADANALCDELSQFDCLRRIELMAGNATSTKKPFSFSALQPLDQLECLDLSNYYELDEQDGNELTRLKSLKKLVVWKDEIAPQLLMRIEKELPNCTIFDAYDEW